MKTLFVILLALVLFSCNESKPVKVVVLKCDYHLLRGYEHTFKVKNLSDSTVSFIQSFDRFEAGDTINWSF